jgi:flagellar biosynthetic protein FliR
MDAALTMLFPLVTPFLLVLFRVAGLFVVAPVFSSTTIPMQVRALLALAISFCVFPMVVRMPVDGTLLGLVLAIVGELSVGLLIGLLASLVFSGVQLGGHLLSQQMGLALSSIYDPMFNEQSTVIEQLAFWLTTVVFFAIGGEQQLIRAIMDSYHVAPMGQGISPELMLQGTLAAVEESFQLAVRIAAPGLVAFFLMSLVMGLLSRAVPQINMMTLGAGANLLLGMVMILVGAATWATLANVAWEHAFSSIARCLNIQGGGGG